MSQNAVPAERRGCSGHNSAARAICLLCGSWHGHLHRPELSSQASRHTLMALWVPCYPGEPQRSYSQYCIIAVLFPLSCWTSIRAMSILHEVAPSRRAPEVA
jgi:hypothetical protein